MKVCEFLNRLKDNSCMIFKHNTNNSFFIYTFKHKYFRHLANVQKNKVHGDFLNNLPYVYIYMFACTRTHNVL